MVVVEAVTEGVAKVIPGGEILREKLKSFFLCDFKTIIKH